MTRLLSILIVTIWCSLTTSSFAQSGEQEVIIIEKTVDEHGNVISQQTKRMKGQYSEEELQELIDEDHLAPDLRSFDLEGLGFGGDMRDFFGTRNTRPTIGVNLDFNDSQAKVAKVYANSGAAEADIRVGDVLISIDHIPISTIEDIHELLSSKSSNDLIKVLIFRDGEEIEKEVSLGSSQGGIFSFDFPEGGGDFQIESFGMPMDLDSIFQDLFDSKGLLDNFRGFGDDLRADKSTKRQMADRRPSLGVFIDDVGTQVVVADVVPDSPADKSGLQKGDIILTIDRNIVTSYREVSAFMNRKKLGDTISLEIDRNGKVITENILLD